MHDVRDAPALHAFVAELIPLFQCDPTARNPLLGVGIDAKLAEYSLTREDFYDTFALHVAREYLSERMDFDTADCAINMLYFWENMVLSDASFAFEIFECFDEGEYSHPGDDADVVPALKYTIPYLRETFEKYGIEIPA